MAEGVQALCELGGAVHGLARERRFDAHLNVRTHFGAVVSGEWRPGLRGYDVIGKAVNVAARIGGRGGGAHRAAAVAGLARVGGAQAADWCARGLRDADDAVRLAVARELPRYDPRRHRRLFELALYDPHPQIAELARKLTARQGYHLLRPSWS